MSLKKAVGFTGGAWILAITALHGWLNLDLFRKTEGSKAQFKVGFLPVT